MATTLPTVTIVSGSGGPYPQYTQSAVGADPTANASSGGGVYPKVQLTTTGKCPQINVLGTLIPVSVTPPIITGTVQVGNTLTATGTGATYWTNTPTSYTYQWNANGIAIGGATASTYALVEAQVGKTITVSVSATNASGTGGPAISAATAAVIDIIPTNITVPTISGASPPTVGSTVLTASNGTWNNLPTSYTYQWNYSGTLQVTLLTTSFNSTAAGYSGYQSRIHFPAASLATVGVGVVGTIRVSFSLGTGSTGATLNAAYIGESGAGSVVAFDGSQVHLLFSGSGTVTGLGPGVLTSDYAAFTIDTTKDLVVAVYWSAGTVTASRLTGVTGTNSYYSNTVIDPSVTTPTYPTGWTTETSIIEFIAEIDFQKTSAGTIAGATSSVYTPQTSDVGNTLTVSVKAVNSGGSSSAATSTATAVVVASPSPNFPNMLNGYAVRPPAGTVAGVDYYVGANAVSYTDWQTLSDPNLTVNTTTGLVSVFAGYTAGFHAIDFTTGVCACVRNGGGGLQPGSTLAVDNCKFAVTAGGSSTLAATGNVLLDTQGVKLQVTNCTFDGTNTPIGGTFPSNYYSLLNCFISGAGDMVVHSCYFLHPAQSCVSFTSPSTAGLGLSPTLSYKFNLTYNHYLRGYPVGNADHRNDQEQIGNNITCFMDTEYNTIYQDIVYDASTYYGAGESLQFGNTAMTLTNPNCSNNTIIAKAVTNNCPGASSASACISTAIRANYSPGVVTGGTMSNNYIDPSGITVVFAPGTCNSGSGWTPSGNVNLVTGGALTPG
jgi:hypothetical protein